MQVLKNDLRKQYINVLPGAALVGKFDYVELRSGREVDYACVEYSRMWWSAWIM